MTEVRSKLFVKSLSIKNFRNYEEISLDLSPGTNLFYGRNAQGKTNLLEAVYLAGTTRSHRGARDREMIKMGEEESHIRMEMDRFGNDYRIDVHLRKNHAKGIAINGLAIRRASELLGITGMVFFSPEDLMIIKNGPAERRRFLDSLLCGIDPVYLDNLARYRKCLLQRGKLLKEFPYDAGDLSMLDVWDAQTVDYGTRIIERRRSLLEELQRTAAGIHSALTGKAEELTLVYEENVSAGDFAAKLRRMRDVDLKMKTTSVGPHRDDLNIKSNGIDLRAYGSQGQQRTAALSLKLSEIDIYEKARGDRPVLLLDDVFSELDADRQQYLIESIKKTQTLLTCTGLDELLENRLKADQMFHVVRGGIE